MIIKEMLFYNRKYIIDKVKKPLMKAIITLANRYPAPTKDNVAFSNTRILLEVCEKFKKYHNNPGRQPMFEAAFRVLIDQYEHDGYYSFVFDWFFNELMERGWSPQKRGFPMYRWWKGPLVGDNTADWHEKLIRGKQGVFPKEAVGV